MKRPAVFRSFLVSMLLLVSAATGAISTDAATGPADNDIKYTPANERGEYNFKITFAEPGMLHADSVRAPGEPFDASSPAAAAYREQLRTQQSAYKQNIAARIGRALEVSHHFMVFDSAIGGRLTPEEAETVRGLSGVVSVERERLYDLDTYRGPQFIGADTIWDGTNTPGGSMLRGEDMVIAVLDTGVQESHPSFANDASCGHGGGNDDKLLSSLDCSSTDTGTIGGVCNGPSPTDTDGHGSHTASTAGGNALDDTAVPAPPVDISGVAPCARIRAYKVCAGTGCGGFDIQAGMSSVLFHGDVDVMNFSISGGASPWTDNDLRKLDLVDAGVFVAASAGNTSTGQPDPVGQVNHRGPWVLSVAASTHDGLLANGLSLDGGPQDVPGLQGTGPALAADFVGDLRYAGDVDAGNFEGCNAFPAGAFAGEAALISRGACNFSVKVDNAVAAGALFVVVFNNVPGTPIVMGGLEATTVSSVMVSDVDGADLIAALGGGTAQVTVEVALSDFGDPALGDVLAGFSFRGPTPAPLQHLQKPDITGPGVNILAAVPGGYDFISGTSMSSPHLAGSATLVRQANPGWTVPEVKSAIQMTASRDGTDDDGTSPWDYDDVGSGRVDLTKAALAGLVMDETTANFEDADPNGGSVDVRDLNLAGVRNVDCTPDCTWTRTVRNTLSDPSSWTVSTSAVGFDIVVSPTTFSFTGNTSETEELTITATPIGNQTGAVAFGEVILTEDGSLSPEQHITVAIMGGDPGAPEIDVDPASLSATVPEGDSDIQTLTVANIGNGDLDWDIVQGGGDSWSDDFDSYANGSDMHGQGGWKGWDNDPTFGALVTDTQASSAPHSVEIVGDSDLVRDTFTGITSGQWTLTAWQYIPGGFTGTTYYILLNTYADGGPNNWSTQVNFNSTTGLVTNDGASGGTASMVTDQWVEIRVEIDFDANTQDFFYDGSLLYSGTWTEENTGGGASNFGAIDLFANGATAVYYDDISLVPDLPVGCDALSDIPWLDASPTSGTTLPAGETDVDVTFDAGGLTSGDVENATLCVTSNDPATPVVQVPVELTVVDGAAPVADITPADFSFTLPLNSTDSDVLNIGNTGDADLDWSIDEAEPAETTALELFRPSRAAQPELGPESRVSGVSAVEQEHRIVNIRLRGGDPVSVLVVSPDTVAPNNLVSDLNAFPDVDADLFTDPVDTITVGDMSPYDVVMTTNNNQWTAVGNSDVVVGDALADYIDAGGKVVVFNYVYDFFGWELAGRFIDEDYGPFQPATSDAAVAATMNVLEPGHELFDGVTSVSHDDSFRLNMAVQPGADLLAEWSDGLPMIAVNEDVAAFNLLYSADANPGGWTGDVDVLTRNAAIWLTGGFGPEGCEAPVDVSWLSASPVSGTTPPAGSEPVDVMVDSTGLAPGVHAALLCVTTNDPGAPLVEVPVSLEVLDQDPPVLAVDPAALDFGDVAIGATEMMSFDVSNAAAAGAADLALTAITPGGDAEFAVTGGDCDPGVTVLPPGDSCTVEVSFTPGAVGAFAGDVTVEGGGQTETVTLDGMGVEQDPAELDVSPLALDFGNVLVGSTGMANVTVSNVAAEGAADLVITEIGVISGEAFSDGGTDCAPLAPQTSCTFEVVFSPTAEGPAAGFFRVDAEDNDAVNVSLSGNGVDPGDGIFEDRFEEL